MNTSVTTAVVLARGLGSRMQRADASAALDPAQAAAAARGHKGMIPDARGRPFLAHILSGLADVGIDRVVVVVAPDHAVIADHFTHHPPTRVRLEYAIQPEPDGTARALLAAAPAVGGAAFLVLNADNLYPAAALRALVALGEPGLVAFDRAGLIEEGGMDADRVRAFALLRADREGYLAELVEKPDPAQFAAMADAGVSMNLWRFDPDIFTACREVPRSARGEYELPEAVALARQRGARFRVVMARAPVLDLSRRGDIENVATALAARRIVP
ncbi:MAG: sugar phosphate nucleotidyltransferase [Gemmatimonadota bacterium]